MEETEGVGAETHKVAQAMLKCAVGGRVRELAHLQDVDNGGRG